MTQDLYSPEWIDRFNKAVEGIDAASLVGDLPLSAKSGTYSLCLEVGTDEGGFFVLLEINKGEVCLSRSNQRPEKEATVSLSVPLSVAGDLADGSLSPAQALSDGLVRARGDFGILVASFELFEEIDRRLSAIGAQGSL